MTNIDDVNDVDVNDVPDDELEQALEEQAEVARSWSSDRAANFYNRVRGRIQRFVDSKAAAAGKATEFLLLVPDVFMLLWRLLGDSRVRGKNKVLLGTAVAYYVFPLDLIPEGIVGPIGYLDDLLFGVYVLNRILSETDPDILREHWAGSDDVLQTIQRVMGAADNLVSKDVVERMKKIVK